jgi:hypothetical protein
VPRAIGFDEKDARFVSALTRYGATAAEIARELEIDSKTLQKHFGEVITIAAAQRELAPLDALVKRARAGSGRAALALMRRLER